MKNMHMWVSALGLNHYLQSQPIVPMYLEGRSFSASSALPLNYQIFTEVTFPSRWTWSRIRALFFVCMVLLPENFHWVKSVRLAWICLFKQVGKLFFQFKNKFQTCTSQKMKEYKWHWDFFSNLTVCLDQWYFTQITENHKRSIKAYCSCAFEKFYFGITL